MMSVCKAGKRQRMRSKVAIKMRNYHDPFAREWHRLLPRPGAARKTARAMRRKRMRSRARRTLTVLG